MSRLLGVVALLVVAWPASADSLGHPVTMWRAEGINNTIYLLGSIHLLREQDHPLPGIFDRAYDDADVLIMELDMDDMDSMATQRLFNESGVLRDGTTLQELMGDDLYRRAVAAAEASDIPIDMLAKSEPWLAAITVELLSLYRIGFNPMLGVEMTMLARAVRDGKRVDGLEAVEEQLAFLDGLSLDAQRDLLLQSLEESARIRESIDEMIRAWHHGDIATLESSLLESFAGHDELNDALVTQRNQRWVSQIGELLDDNDDYLIVVGALHLVGELGVPRLLEKKGVTIEQLSDPAPVR